MYGPHAQTEHIPGDLRVSSLPRVFVTVWYCVGNTVRVRSTNCTVHTCTHANAHKNYTDKFIRDNYMLSDNTVGNTVTPYGVLIASKKNILKMVTLQISALPSNMGRRFLSAKLKMRDSNKYLWVNTVHLESLMNTKYRIAQLQLIFGTYMKEVPTPPSPSFSFFFRSFLTPFCVQSKETLYLWEISISEIEK